MSNHILIQDPGTLSTRFSNQDRLGYDGSDDELNDLNDLIEHNLAPEAEEEIGNAPLEFRAIERFLLRIPPREADLITLYHRDKLKQEQIAKLFGITQAAVSYRLHRGIRRIQFLRTIPELDKDRFDLELGPEFSDQDREILWRMYETTCQSEIAKQMKLTQGRVRHRFFRALSKIKDLIANEARKKRVEIQMRAKRASEPRSGRAARGTTQLPPDSDAEKRLAEYMSSDAVRTEIDDCINGSRYAKYWTVFHAISDKHFNILHEVALPQFQNRGDAHIITLDTPESGPRAQHG